MARRTRKAKIAAAARRQKLLLEKVVVRAPRAASVHTMAHVPGSPSAQARTPAISLSHFAFDLKKSLILTTIIIALEIGLYYGNLYTYLGTK